MIFLLGENVQPHLSFPIISCWQRKRQHLMLPAFGLLCGAECFVAGAAARRVDSARLTSAVHAAEGLAALVAMPHVVVVVQPLAARVGAARCPVAAAAVPEVADAVAAAAAGVAEVMVVDLARQVVGLFVACQEVAEAAAAVPVVALQEWQQRAMFMALVLLLREFAAAHLLWHSGTSLAMLLAS